MTSAARGRSRAGSWGGRNEALWPRTLIIALATRTAGKWGKASNARDLTTIKRGRCRLQRDAGCMRRPRPTPQRTPPPHLRSTAPTAPTNGAPTARLVGYRCRAARWLPRPIKDSACQRNWVRRSLGAPSRPQQGFLYRLAPSAPRLTRHSGDHKPPAAPAFLSMPVRRAATPTNEPPGHWRPER